MTYAIEMYFDKETEEKIMSLAKKVADAGLSTKYLEWKTRPHITLAVFNDVGEDRCTKLFRLFWSLSECLTKQRRFFCHR